MGQEKMKQKLLLAVIQGDDYTETVDDLNRGGFFATVLSSTGGFLKKRSMTLMIGVEEHQMQAVLDILKRCAGRRQQMTYSNLSMSAGGPNPSIPMMPVQMSVGGVVVLAITAAVALQLRKTDGRLGKFRVVPVESNYLMTFLTCGVTAVATNLFGLRDLIIAPEAIVGPEGDKETVELISMQGYYDSPEAKACAEWQEFYSKYVPTLNLDNSIS